MTKEKIMEEFLNSDLDIISEQKLMNYIEYCINNNQSKHIKFKTAYHHILPKNNFIAFANLKENHWNGVYLTHANHYYAHWLLSEAVNDYSIIYSFCAMHNKDTRTHKISEEDLIPSDIFQQKMEKRSYLHNDYMNSLIIVEGKETTIRKEAARKRLENINMEELSKKATRTRKEERQINGITTTIYKEIHKKRLKTISKEITIDGKITTKAKEISKAAAKTKRAKGRKFNLYNINDGLLQKNVEQATIKNISQGLFRTSKENYLGKSIASKIALNKNNSLHLIGLYIEEI